VQQHSLGYRNNDKLAYVRHLRTLIDGAGGHNLFKANRIFSLLDVN